MVSKYWKQFENSGKVEDYLSFLAREHREESKPAVRVGDDAGAYLCNGNHIETDSGRGIRQSGIHVDERTW